MAVVEPDCPAGLECFWGDSKIAGRGPVEGTHGFGGPGSGFHLPVLRGVMRAAGICPRREDYEY